MTASDKQRQSDAAASANALPRSALRTLQAPIKGFRGVFLKEWAQRQAILASYGPLPWEAPGLARWERVVAFLEDLTITSGPFVGRKLKLRPFQVDYIRAVYDAPPGAIRPVRTAIFCLGRKNGKTELAAGLALCHVAGPEAEQRGEIYSCANDRFQAGKIFNEMLAIINAHEYLKARCTAILFNKQISDLMTSSIFSALSSEVKTKMGLNPSFVIYDEYGQSPNDSLYRAMDSAMGARAEPLLMVISTQAASDNAPFSRLIDYGIKVRDKIIDDPTFHLSLYTSDITDDPWSEVTWRKANPALGDFRSMEDVKRLASQAQRMPGQENSFRNLILNQRVDAHTSFVTHTAWKACDKPAMIMPGSLAYAALDLGSTKDMSALVIIAQDVEGSFHVEPHFWLPGVVEERMSEDRAPYEEWIHLGFLNYAGETTDPRQIAIKIAELTAKYRIQTMAFDRWRMAEIKRELEDIGCPVKLVPHGQGYKDMSPAVDILERLIIQKRIRHGGHPVLTMNAFNSIVTKDAAGGRKLDKAKSRGRIDGMVALAMAFSIAMVKSPEPTIDIEALIG